MQPPVPKEKLRVDVYAGDMLYFSCDYARLDPYAPSLRRKFVFCGLQHQNFTKDNLNLWSAALGGTFFICIMGEGRSGDFYETCKIHLEEAYFDFDTSDDDILANKKEWSIDGRIITSDDDYYFKQEYIDVQYLWAQGKPLIWEDLPVGSLLKTGYQSITFDYTSLHSTIIERDVYKIDMSKVKECKDLIYYSSLEFFGYLGYMGTYFYNYHDCLSVILEEKGSEYLAGRKIMFFNTSQVAAPEVSQFLDDTKGVFSAYGFLVTDLP